MDIRRIYLSDTIALESVNKLLALTGIRRDHNLEAIYGIYDGEKLVGTGSYYANTLRCLAIDPQYQGQGLMAILVDRLLEIQLERGNADVFIYTKSSMAHLFEPLGFYRIAATDQAVFLENNPGRFKRYLDELQDEANYFIKERHMHVSSTDQIAGIVMHANPFTLGHLHLLDFACEKYRLVHLFIVETEFSPISYAVRKQLIIDSTAHLNNLCIHGTDQYLVSQSVFPSYFVQDNEQAQRVQILLDADLFRQIANYLGIGVRVVGEEPDSEVTRLYNTLMAENFHNNLRLEIIRRKTIDDGVVISASKVRRALVNRDFQFVKKMLPIAVYNFFRKPSTAIIIEKMRREGRDV